MSRQNKKPAITSDNIRSYCSVVANELGINTAIVFHYIAYWVEHNYINKIPSAYKEDRYWMFKTREDIGAWLGMNETSVRYAIKILLDKNILVRSNKLNRDSRIRTYWYSLTTGILDIKGTTYENLEVIKQLKTKENIVANDNLLIHKSSLPTEKNEGCINIEETDIYEVKEVSNINITDQANACSLEVGIDSSFLEKEKQELTPNQDQQGINIPKTKEGKTFLEEERVEPTTLEENKEPTPNLPEQEENLDSQSLPNQWELDKQSKYQRVVDPETKKTSPRYSQEQYEKAVNLVNTWVKYGGTKHKIMPYDDASNKTFMKILDAVNNIQYNILDFYKKHKWTKNWHTVTGLSEESLKKAIERLGGDEQAFKYACGQHCVLIASKQKMYNHRQITKSFSDFLTMTNKTGGESSWLLQHIVSNDFKQVQGKFDYFFNSPSVPELDRNLGQHHFRDCETWFTKDTKKEDIIAWVNYLYSLFNKVNELRPSGMRDNQLGFYFGDIAQEARKKRNSDSKPYYFTFGKKDYQRDFIKNYRSSGWGRWVNSFNVLLNSDDYSKLPKYSSIA